MSLHIARFRRPVTGRSTAANARQRFRVDPEFKRSPARAPAQPRCYCSSPPQNGTSSQSSCLQIGHGVNVILDAASARAAEHKHYIQRKRGDRQAHDMRTTQTPRCGKTAHGHFPLWRPSAPCAANTAFPEQFGCSGRLRYFPELLQHWSGLNRRRPEPGKLRATHRSGRLRRALLCPTIERHAEAMRAMKPPGESSRPAGTGSVF